MPLADHLPLLGFRVQREDHSLVLANVAIISAIVMMMMVKSYYILSSSPMPVSPDSYCPHILVHSRRAPNSSISLVLLVSRAVCLLFTLSLLVGFGMLLAREKRPVHLLLCLSPVLIVKAFAKEVSVLLVLVLVVFDLIVNE